MAKAKKRPAKKVRVAARTKVKPKKKIAKKPSKKARPVATAAKPKARSARPARVAAAPARNPLRDLAQRIVALTIAHDDDGCFMLYAPHVESVEQGQAPTVGIDALRQKFAGWRAMAPQSTWRARSVAADGNTIVIEWEGDVTFATGKQATMKEVAIHEIDNGKIVRERFYYDRGAIQP